MVKILAEAKALLVPVTSQFLKVVVSFYETISKFGSVFFLLVQVVLLLDFVHGWNDNWVNKDEQFWYIVLFVVLLVCYVAPFYFSGLFFHFFTPSGHDCGLNTFFIVLTLICVFLFGIVALHPAVTGSLLPASVISVYCTYLCYSGLASEPWYYECNDLHNHSKAFSTGSLTLGLLTTEITLITEPHASTFNLVSFSLLSFLVLVCLGQHLSRSQRFFIVALALLSAGAIILPLIVLLLGTTLFLFQQLAGINAVVYYFTSVFRSGGIASDVASSAIVGASNVFGTAIASSLMDEQGRKILLITSFSGMVVSMLLLSLSFSWKVLAQYSGSLAVIGTVKKFGLTDTCCYGNSGGCCCGRSSRYRKG